jgi:predicted  nucleic acid-binding Zn-ribbon protein
MIRAVGWIGHEVNTPTPTRDIFNSPNLIRKRIMSDTFAQQAADRERQAEQLDRELEKLRWQAQTTEEEVRAGQQALAPSEGKLRDLQRQIVETERRRNDHVGTAKLLRQRAKQQG